MRTFVLSLVVVFGACGTTEPLNVAGLGAGAAGAGTVDRSHLSATGTAPLDYADRALWACRPGNDPDECQIDLDATEVMKSGTSRLVQQQPASDPGFDCFFMYPTVYFEPGNMQDLSDLTALRDPLQGQIARFGRMCRVYVPLYRQSSAESDAAGAHFTGDVALATNDLLAAFDYYVEHLSVGRKFVVMGHSQGSILGLTLLQRRIDNDPVLRARMLSAVLLGGDARVPPGHTVGGTFKNVPSCTRPGQTQCLIAFNSYAQVSPPIANEAFGKHNALGDVVCTEPGALAGNRSGRYRGSYFPNHIENLFYITPGYLPANMETPFALYRDYFQGTCVQKNGFSYLEISTPGAADDLREDPPYMSPLAQLWGVGLHLVDYSLALDDLIEALTLQAAAARQ